MPNTFDRTGGIELEPGLGLPGGMEWAIICCMTLPVLLLVMGILFIVNKNNNAQRTPNAPAVPAGWHPDPTGRHELRYWDGLAWTQSVSDDGQVTENPL